MDCKYKVAENELKWNQKEPPNQKTAGMTGDTQKGIPRVTTLLTVY